MGPLDALIHLLNFFAPALGLAALAAGLVKLVWWRHLRAVSWWRLTRAAALASAAVLVLGLIAFGRDGKMATYAGMVLASSLALSWSARRAG